MKIKNICQNIVHLRCQLPLQATQVDSGQRYTMAALRVFVQSSNENPPRFAQSHVVTSVMENVPIGTTVTQVEAMDTDKVSYELTNQVTV